jgi:hypothetical protein
LVPFAYVTFAAFFPRQYTKAINAWLQLTGHKTRMAEEDSLRISTRLMLGDPAVSNCYAGLGRTLENT